MTESTDVEPETDGGFDWREFTPDDSPLTPIELKDDLQVQDLSTAKLAVGDSARGFARPVYDFSDGTRRTTGAEFDLLAEAAEKPVALIFGSYT